MVEMLGVLAVMGVLSVGGVAMYTSAMNKHRANELLNEASKRAVIVAMQLASGRQTASIAEFTNNNLGYAVFSSAEITPSNGQFELTFTTAPSEAICAQMITATTGNNTVMNIPTGCAKITFNVDLSHGVTTEPENTNECNGNGHKVNNECVCDTGWYGEVCDSDCNGFKNLEEECIPCSSNDQPDGVYETTPEECARCGNTRQQLGNILYNGKIIVFCPPAN